MKLNQQIHEVLNQCVAENNLVRLPQMQLDRDVYVQVANRLNNIGGKWKGGKVQAFVFNHDPTDLLADIQSGKKRNLKQEFQFFETPEDLAKGLVTIASILPSHWVLEPSAGQGAIIRHIPQCQQIDYCELDPNNLKVLWNMPSRNFLQVVGGDFLNLKTSFKYHRIVANPPFSKNQDIDHIYKMYDVLIPHGRMVSLASKHWQKSNNRKERGFRDWLQAKDADVIDVAACTFKDSGTMIETVIITIDKNEATDVNKL